MKKTFFLLLTLCCCSLFTQAQDNGVHHQSTIYDWPEDQQVLKKLDKWQDEKFGMLIHWGLYSVPGVIESWGLCSEDWINRPDSFTYNGYKKWYWGQKDNFNPVKFDPEQWASVADNAGMKYVVFTTKHHDGFCMFDTKQTDFKITDGPFKNNPKSNVAKYVFDAFRDKGFMIGAYFSKPDWHSQDFWWDKYATPNRNVNYDIRKHPEKWDNYKQFTFNQISELMHDYGSIDILWLDGGWVRPRETVNEEVLSWGAPIPEWDQKIDMPKIAKMAREAQPGLLMVDRTVHGPYENYQTPERSIPETQLPYPWESCITLGHSWGYVSNQNFKSSDEVIHDLIEIVAKGGSLLLGVGPNPDGTIDDEVVTRLNAVGEWMDKNGEAIYGTRITKNYQDNNVFFTKGKNGKLYALACIDEGESVPASISWTGNVPAKGTRITLLATGQKVSWKSDGDKVVISVPKSFRDKPYPALTFSFQSLGED